MAPRHPDAQRPTRDIDPTELSRLIGNARPSYANLELADPELEAEIAEGTLPPTSIAALETQRLPVSYEPPPRESFESIERRSSAMVRETLELPIGELSLDEAEVQPLEEARAHRAFLRIDTSDGEIRSKRLQPTPKSARACTHGTAVVARRRIPWLACGIAVLASAAVTALLFAH